MRKKTILKRVNLIILHFFLQNPNYVKTKFSRAITAYFIGSLPDIYNNVLEWKSYLQEKGFTDKDPLFSKLVSSFTKEGLHTFCLEKSIIRSAGVIHEIFHKAFKNNNLPCYKLHSFRHSITRLALESEQSPLLISALSQNMGHQVDSVLLNSYGSLPEHKRGVVLKRWKLE